MEARRGPSRRRSGASPSRGASARSGRRGVPTDPTTSGRESRTRPPGAGRKGARRRELPEDLGREVLFEKRAENEVAFERVSERRRRLDEGHRAFTLYLATILR